jgi:hypothetical protein
MNRTRAWYRLLTFAVCGTIAALAAGEAWAQQNRQTYRAGLPQPNDSIRLDGGDSSGGTPTRTVAPPVRRPVAQPPGAQGWSNGSYPPSAVRGLGTRALPPGAANLPGPLRKGRQQPAYSSGRTERSPTLTEDRNRGGGFGTRTTPGWGNSNVRKNRNWTLGGEPWRPIQPGANPAAGAAGNPRRAVNLIDARLAQLLEQRELARTKYEHGGGYSRDLRDFNDLQREIVKLQDQRMGIVRANTANAQTLRQAENNYRATRGLNAQRYRGVRDTSWPVGERPTRRWLNQAN